MKEKLEIILDPQKMNEQSIIFMVAIVAISVACYYSIWGFVWNVSVEAFLLFYVLNFIGIFIHELIHISAFIVVGKARKSDVKLGFLWKSMTPYAHCRIPLSMRAYKISVLLPTLLTGVVPLIIGLTINSLLLVFVAAFLIAGGFGDLMMYRKLRSFTNNAVVIDHPSEIGCIVEMVG